MISLGYTLSSEERTPRELVALAAAAEEAGFEFALVSDHYHREEDAIETARRVWPNAALPGDLGQELALPRHFQQATSALTVEQVAEAVICGPDPERHSHAIEEFADAGFDHVYVQQIGPDQEDFFRFYEREILPDLVAR